MSQKKIQPWALSLMTTSTLTQATIYVMRPMITYRALEIDLSPSMIGLIAAIYALFPVLLALYFGTLVGRVGESKFLITGSTLMALTGVALVFANSALMLLITAAIAGLAHLACMVGGQTMIALKSKVEDQNTNFGHYTFSASLGHLIGPLAATAVAGSNGALPKSTNAAFVLSIILALLSILPIVKWWREKPTVVAKQDAGTLGAAFGLLKKPGMAATVFISLAVSSTSDLLVVFLPLLGSEREFSSSSIGIILALRAATSMASRFFLGRMTEMFDAKWLLLVSISISTASLVLIGLSTDVLQLAIVVFIAGFTLGLGQPMTMTNVSRKSSSDERALAVSLRLTGNRAGQFILPMAAGAIAGGLGIAAVFYALAIFLSLTLPLSRKD